ncbi:MAG: hypothetical protein R3C18_05700 [Planctomycetaceae bacterium]
MLHHPYGHGYGLTPDRLQLFIAGLSGLDPEEVRKAKLLFLKNELSQLRALKASYAGFGTAQGCFGFIPIFWPVLHAQRSMMSATMTSHKEQLRNALDVWRNDLGQDAIGIERELDAL